MQHELYTPPALRTIAVIAALGSVLLPSTLEGCSDDKAGQKAVQMAEIPPGTSLYTDSALDHRCGKSGPDTVRERVTAHDNWGGDFAQTVQFRTPGGKAAQNCGDYVWGDVDSLRVYWIS